MVIVFIFQLRIKHYKSQHYKHWHVMKYD